MDFILFLTMQFLMFQENDKYSIAIKDILLFLGAAIGFIWSTATFLINRRDSKKLKQSELDRTDSIDNRKETESIIIRYKTDLEESRKDYGLLMDKYEELYTNKMAIQIELAVIAYEHELLYSKLNEEESKLVRKRVEVFKDSLTEIANRDKKMREVKIEEIKKSAEEADNSK